jgi:hypothetical protein
VGSDDSRHGEGPFARGMNSRRRICGFGTTEFSRGMTVIVATTNRPFLAIGDAYEVKASDRAFKVVVHTKIWYAAGEAERHA